MSNRLVILKNFREYIMHKYVNTLFLSSVLSISCIVFANNELNIETNMENVLEVGRENQELSASSQDKIDATEKQTDKIINDIKLFQNK